MKILTKLAVAGTCLALAACEPAPPPGAFIEEIPEGVLAIAAPGQNLLRVNVQEDGCYWWLYDGPVETVYIPLLTEEGRMICTRAQS